VIRAETRFILENTIKKQIAADAAKIRARQQKGTLSKSKLQELLRRRGLAKQSWLALASQLNLEVAAPGYVKNAEVRGQEYDQKVKATENVRGGQYMIVLHNSMRTTIVSQGKWALIGVINRRTNNFYNNVRRGVFEKVKTIAKKYPGIGVKGL